MSFPAIHVLDGPVSFRLEWNGRSFVFGGDSYPNKWFIKYAKGAELVVHECFYTPEVLARILGTPYAQAVWITSYVHTLEIAVVSGGGGQLYGDLRTAVMPVAFACHGWTIAPAMPDGAPVWSWVERRHKRRSINGMNSYGLKRVA